jgi:hypothetical protein
VTASVLGPGDRQNMRTMRTYAEIEEAENASTGGALAIPADRRAAPRLAPALYMVTHLHHPHGP